MKRAAKRGPQGKSPASSSAPLRLEGEFSIYRALEIKEILLTALAATTDLAIDLSGVSELDTAGVQLLMAAKRSAVEAGKSIRIVDASASVQDVFALLELACYFDESQTKLPAAH